MPTIWKTAPRMSCAVAWGWSSTGTAPCWDGKRQATSARESRTIWTGKRRMSGNWSAGVDYSLEAGNRQLNQSGRAGVMMEF